MMKYIENVVTLELDQEKCVGCGMCTTVCPHGVLRVEDGKARIVDRDACIECGACVRNCPVEALTVDVGVGCARAVLSEAMGKGCRCGPDNCC